ncbi:MAG TPA: GNAT family N-acetyltransferase [Anaerolineae bacterium]
MILRKFTLEDAPFIVDLLNQPSWLRFIGDRGIRSIDDAEKYIVNVHQASYERLGFGFYLTELKEGYTPIGMCGLIKRETLNDVDIGFAFLPQYWSKGYAFEAASAVMEYARDVLNLKRIVAIATPDNDRSIKLLKRIGMEFESMTIAPEDGEELAVYGADLAN